METGCTTIYRINDAAKSGGDITVVDALLHKLNSASEIADYAVDEISVMHVRQSRVDKITLAKLYGRLV